MTEHEQRLAKEITIEVRRLLERLRYHGNPLAERVVADLSYPEGAGIETQRVSLLNAKFYQYYRIQ